MGSQRVGLDRVPFTFALVTGHKLQKLAGESKEAQSALRTDGADLVRVQGRRRGNTLRPGFLVCMEVSDRSLSCPALCDPWTTARQAPLSMHPPRRTLERVAMASSRGASRPSDRNTSPTLAAEFFTAEPPSEAQLGTKDGF